MVETKQAQQNNSRATKELVPAAPCTTEEQRSLSAVRMQCQLFVWIRASSFLNTTIPAARHLP
jgi:hypothetical protein